MNPTLDSLKKCEWLGALPHPPPISGDIIPLWLYPGVYELYTVVSPTLVEALLLIQGRYLAISGTDGDDNPVTIAIRGGAVGKPGEHIPAFRIERYNPKDDNMDHIGYYEIMYCPSQDLFLGV